jgi:hypothetical protein
MGVLTLFGVAMAVIITSIYPDIDKSHYAEATAAITGTLALLFGLVFALSIANLEGKSGDASNATTTEATTLAQMVGAASNLPVEIRIPVRRAIQEYDQAIVQSEFKTMETGNQSTRASVALDDLYATYHAYVGAPSPSGEIIGNGLSNINSLVSERRSRLDISQRDLPGLLRGLLIIGVILFILTAFPTNIKNRGTQILVMGGIASFLAFTFALTVILEYPFSGGQVVNNSRVYKQGVLAQFFTNETPPTPVNRLDTVALSAQDLVGEWTSAASKNGVIIMRVVNGEILAAYREDNGGFVGHIDPDGVLRGWWCEEPSRQPIYDAGQVEWRMLKTKGNGPVRLDGRWRDGDSSPFMSGWSLEKVGPMEPIDLAHAFDNASRFCVGPGSAAASSTTTTTTTAPPLETTTSTT